MGLIGCGDVGSSYFDDMSAATTDSDDLEDIVIEDDDDDDDFIHSDDDVFIEDHEEEKDEIEQTFQEVSGRNERKRSNRRKILLFLIVALAVSSAFIFLSVVQNERPPVVRTVHIECDNEENPTVARYGNMITLQFTFVKSIEGVPVVYIRGKQVAVYGEGTSFYAQYFVEVEGDKGEVVTFAIKDYKSPFGKVGEEVTTTTDGSSVMIAPYQ